MAEHFDVVVLGGGPGGYAAALYGAAAGLKIAMVEESRVGGTCLNRGCIPAKELLQTAEVLRAVRGAKEFGVDAGQPTVDLPASLARKQTVVDGLVKGLEGLLKGRKVTVVPGRGTIVDVNTHHIRVSDGSELTGDALIIATGSSPRSLPGLDFDGVHVLSSDHVLEMAEVPKRVAVIGGGAIGCEFASYLADVGAEVTILEALPQLLNGVDKQAANVVVREFKKRGITVHAGVAVSNIDLAGDDLVLRFDTGNGTDQVTVDKVIVSVGRKPRSAGIGLEDSFVEIDDRGYITVDAQMRTGAAGVYAVGDVVATPQLAHVAFSEAMIAIKTILGEEAQGIAYDKVPWGIYCHPEVAFVGLTEEQAIGRGYEVETSVHHFVGNSRAKIIGETAGLVKIVAEKDTGVMLGVHIVGPWATEQLGQGYLAVNWEATVDDIAPLIQPHPTLSELFGESVLALTGRSLHA